MEDNNLGTLVIVVRDNSIHYNTTTTTTILTETAENTLSKSSFFIGPICRPNTTYKCKYFLSYFNLIWEIAVAVKVLKIHHNSFLKKQ